MKQGKLSEATIQFRNALKIDPHYADAQTMLGKADLELKLYPEAYKQLKAAVDANGDNLPARTSLGSLYAIKPGSFLTRRRRRNTFSNSPLRTWTRGFCWQSV